MYYDVWLRPRQQPSQQCLHLLFIDYIGCVGRPDEILLVAYAYEGIGLHLIWLQRIPLYKGIVPGLELLVALFGGSRVDQYTCISACIEHQYDVWMTYCIAYLYRRPLLTPAVLPYQYWHKVWVDVRTWKRSWPAARTIYKLSISCSCAGIAYLCPRIAPRLLSHRPLGPSW